eukprot:TRINITY_DN8589_c1_g10_i1.p1 TRINITY_DN8589_c1_g10~~TRINITY_DN8589_c1_g10_i1.p1  ORF type:complete len:322 (+),score=32.63 TRINITY_DN8589_c1_g10_i1:68-1033(+)
MVRVWKFLDPSSGEHTVRVKGIGTSRQEVSLDGTKLPACAGQTTFAGPDAMLLQLKRVADPKPFFSLRARSHWALYVNERLVEEAGSSRDSLRDFRNMPDGSYTIATGFFTTGVKRHACRKFKFFLDDKPRSILVAYKDRCWQVLVDGELIDRESRGLLDISGTIEFEVPVGASDVRVPARLEISWSIKELTWKYHLVVASEVVPATWTSYSGRLRTVTPAKIYSGQPLEPGDHTCSEDDDEEDAEEAEVEDQKENQSPSALPQGVSYDAEARAYQATIMDPSTKRFVFLGEFGSPEAAHERYLEALARYSPEKKLAPATS